MAVIGWTLEDIGHLAQGRAELGVLLTRGELAESFCHFVPQLGDELWDVPDGTASSQDMPAWRKPEHQIYRILRQRPWVWQ